MKQVLTVVFICGLVFGLLTFASGGKHIVAATPKAHGLQGCGLETIRGAYGFYRTGSNANGLLVAVGVVTFDGRGGSSFRQTIRANGVETSDLFTDAATDAMYSVNSDCTGEFLNPDGSAFGHAVFVDGGEQGYFLSLTGSNSVYGVMKRMESER